LTHQGSTRISGTRSDSAQNKSGAENRTVEQGRQGDSGFLFFAFSSNIFRGESLGGHSKKYVLKREGVGSEKNGGGSSNSDTHTKYLGLSLLQCGRSRALKHIKRGHRLNMGVGCIDAHRLKIQGMG
jgi:hypothetical protein